MSYCRWSTDDFQCDVYAYESVDGGFVVHVAGMRIVFAEPLPPDSDTQWTDPASIAAFLQRHQMVVEIVDRSERVPIGLPCDGDTFREPDASACADRLEQLRSMGYLVPQFAIDALREEAAEDCE